MWWCCLKFGQKALGCKFDKHDCKEQDEEDEEKDDDDIKKSNKNIRCTCCKELGHSFIDCPRDPNFRTKQNPIDELDRINQIKEIRKLFVDTQVITTHFLKKCIKVPKIFDEIQNKQLTHKEAEELWTLQ